MVIGKKGAVTLDKKIESLFRISTYEKIKFLTKYEIQKIKKIPCQKINFLQQTERVSPLETFNINYDNQ